MTTTSSIEILVNGRPRPAGGSMSVADLVRELGVQTDLVAVEINRDLVPRRSWDSRLLSDGDRVEIVEFVGGG